MLKTSVLVSFLVTLYNIFKKSTVYKIIESIITFFGNMFCGTAFFRCIRAAGGELPRENSLFYKLIKKAGGAVFSVSEKIVNISKSGFIYKSIKRLFEGSIILNPENFLLLGIFAMFICPHEVWNNGYGLIYSIVLALLYILSPRENAFGRNGERIWLPFILFAFTVLLSVMISADIKDSVRVLMFFVTSFILCTVVFAMLSNEKRFDKMCMAVYAAFIILGAVAVVQKIIGVEVDELLTDVELNGNMGRVFSTWANPNNFAEFLIIFFPFCFAFAATREGAKKKTVALALLLIPFAALLFTYSRSGWLGFAVTLITFVILYNKKMLPAMVLLVIMMIPLLPSSVIDRILTIGNLEDTSSSYRIDIWTGTVAMLRCFWYSGTGLGPVAFSKIYPDFAVEMSHEAPHTHMLFLEVFAEMGILGLVCFVLLIVCLIARSCTAASKIKNGTMKLYTISAASSMMGILTIGFAEYVWFYPRVMFAFFIAIGMAMAAVKISAGKNFEG